MGQKSIWRICQNLINYRHLDGFKDKHRKEIKMEIIKTGSYHLEKLSGNTYKVYRQQYAIGTLTEYGEVELSDEIIKGYAKKPHSGYWISEIEKIIKNR